MFRRAMARRMRMGSGSEVLNGAAQPLFELDLRLVAEHFAGGGQVGLGVADVAGARRLVRALDRLAEQTADRVGDRVDALRLATRDVERAAAGSLRAAGGDRHGDRVL